jgi:spore maturation protein CgeB
MSGRVRLPDVFFWPGVRTITHRFPALYGRAITYEEINKIWNRSRVSYTPMESSRVPSILQIKSRTFEMGLSGTLMLCNRSPNLDLYYDEGREYVGFDTLEECADKARYYLAHEAERAQIAMAYRRRTLAEHLWRHRFANLFADIVA